MLGIGTGPQAETVVVLGRQNQHFEARILQRGYPLCRIKIRGIEQGRVLCAISPFLAGKGIHAKVRKSREFKLLPGNLVGCGYGIHGDRCIGRTRRRALLLLDENIAQVIYRIAERGETAAQSGKTQG